MFKRQPKTIEELVRTFARRNGLETPLLQRRLINAWEEVAGDVVAQYTEEKQIRNQTLWVKITSPALRAELQMRNTELTAKLNAAVGAQIITEVRTY